MQLVIKNSLVIALCLQLTGTICAPVSALAATESSLSPLVANTLTVGGEEAPLALDRSITLANILRDTNSARLQAGLSALAVNDSLMAAAGAKAQDMQVNQYWDHFRPLDHKAPWDFIQEAGYSYQTAGENLARGFTQTDQTVQAWLDSPTHKANLLSEKYTETGFAIYQGLNSRNQSVTVVVQLFGSR